MTDRHLADHFLRKDAPWLRPDAEIIRIPAEGAQGGTEYPLRQL